MHRLRTAFLGLTLVFALTGVAALFAAPGVASGARETPAPPGPGQVPPASAAGEDAGDAVARVVRGNLFALDRSAPRSRYSPGEAESSEPVPGPVAAASPVEPVLLGTIAGVGAGSALIRFAGSQEPRLMQVGETVATWRLTQVDDRSATLEGPLGSRRLALRSATPGTP